ncbi:hypothetical protein KIN20_015378 [Parelaphostrongylus tenuis]|uniref:Uncharacterized protein n=1 Tax=Parelaphostrongylus tenuis TaxID=148309 RepID=A0AAD5QSF8_PARTN|nr:hypothetical protein KIN20_015378 [Parelaphostrongylus tenuis]
MDADRWKLPIIFDFLRLAGHVALEDARQQADMISHVNGKQLRRLAVALREKQPKTISVTLLQINSLLHTERREPAIISRYSYRYYHNGDVLSITSMLQINNN